MLICVTSRRLCPDDFLQRIARLAQAKPAAILLREKDLAMPAYASLARQVQTICERCGVRLIVHCSHPDDVAAAAALARKLQLQLQLSLPALRAYSPGRRSVLVGASVHSTAEAAEAQALGAAYLIAGHVYVTDCKPGLAPRGLPFLRQVCQAAALPVFAIGGITPDKLPAILACGAAGCCVMSAAMTCREPAVLVNAFAAEKTRPISRQFNLTDFPC